MTHGEPWLRMVEKHLSGPWLRPKRPKRAEVRGLQVVQHPSGEEFLMILVHYSR